MKAGIGNCRWHKAIVFAGLGVFAFGSAAFAAPDTVLKGKKNRGAELAGTPGVGVVTIYDNLTIQRGGASAAGSAEALIFDQSNDSGFGWFLKSDTAHLGTTFAHRMIPLNGWAPGDSIASYTATYFHSTSDDVALGNQDLTTELWDGDPASMLETVCTVGGVSAPIPGTVANFSVPYGAVALLRAELGAKVAYGCDRMWMAMQIDTACRGAWRLSGIADDDTFNAPPNLGASNGIWMVYPCEAFTACPTDTGRGSGFCCGSPEEACDHGTDGGAECSTPAAQAITFCGDGLTDYEVADIDIPGVEEGYVASLFAATETTMSIVPISVDAPAGGSTRRCWSVVETFRRKES